jgi:hypothetical protein
MAMSERFTVFCMPLFVFAPATLADCTNTSTSMMAAAVGNDAAGGQIFNAVTNRAVTLNGMAEICAKACGVEPKIVNYDVTNLPDGVEVKKAFPFRPIHFYSFICEMSSRITRTHPIPRLGGGTAARGPSPRRRQGVARTCRPAKRRDLPWW